MMSPSRCRPASSDEPAFDNRADLSALALLERDATVTIINNTSKDFTGLALHVKHGKLSPTAPSEIPAQSSAQFKAMISFLSSPSGTLNYTYAAANDIAVEWNHPIDGGSSSYSCSGPDGISTAVFMPSPSGHQQQVSVMFSEKPLPNATWMADIGPSLGSKTILELCLPGSHDSGTYSLTEEVSPAAPDFVKKIEKIAGGKLFLPTIRNWSVSQSVDIYTQLVNGVRYLDLRTCYDAKKDQLRIVHGLYGTTLDDVLAQIGRYLGEFAKEILILHFQSFDQMTPQLHARLIPMLLNAVGQSALVTKANANSTVDQLWSAGQRVFAVYHDSASVAQHDFLFDQNFVNNPWANVPKTGDLKSFLDANVDSTPPSSVFALQGILTEDDSTIAEGLVNPELGKSPHSLEELSIGANSALPGWLAGDWKSKRITVVLSDFSTNSGVTFQAIQRCKAICNGTLVTELPKPALAAAAKATESSPSPRCLAVAAATAAVEGTATGTSTSFRFKVGCSHAFQRFSLDTLSWERVVSLVCARSCACVRVQQRAGGLVLQYTDAEGDCVTVSSAEELAEAFHQLRQESPSGSTSHVLRLSLASTS